MTPDADPLARGAAPLPPTRGEGCLLRYDPDALSEQHGTEFPGAAELWRRTGVAAAVTQDTADDEAERE